MIHCMKKEISLQKKYLEGETVETIYFGGGTPSLLDPKQLEELLKEIHSSYTVVSNAEITVECNPDDINEDVLKGYYTAGINRISLGVQTFDDKMLKFLNRLHDQAQARNSIEYIEKSSINNYSIDLIYALPSENPDLFHSDLSIALDYQPPHISAYCLTIEEKTAFGKWVERGKLLPVDEDLSADQYEHLINSLEGNGYEHYEISNFAKPGYESSHNKAYWEHHKFLGIGPGAHSFNGTSRQHNIKNNSGYIKSIEQDNIPFEKIVMTKNDLINEYILTSLRTSLGCDLNFLRENHGVELILSARKILDLYSTHGFLEFNNSTVKLLRKGKFLADKIASDLFFPTA